MLFIIFVRILFLIYDVEFTISFYVFDWFTSNRILFVKQQNIVCKITKMQAFEIKI